MQFDSALQILEKMDEFSDRMADLRAEKSDILEKEDMFGTIRANALNKYGRKFERIKKNVRNNVTKAEIETLAKAVYDESLKTQIKRFIGIAGKQMDEYNDLMDKLDTLLSVYAQRRLAVEQNIEAQKKQLISLFINYEEAYQSILSSVSPEEIESGYQEPEERLKPFIYLGDMEQPLPENENVIEIARERLLTSSDGEWIRIPGYVFIKETFLCSVEYEKTQEERALAFMRSVFYQVLTCLPMYQYDFWFMDARNGGKNLEYLISLANAKDASPEGIEESLFSKGYQMLHCAMNSEDIRSMMNELERYIEQVSRLLAGIASVEEYNKKSEKKIPWRFVIIEGITEEFDEGAQRKLQKIFLNAGRCGISVILLREKQQKVFPGLLDDFMRIECLSKGEQIQMEEFTSPFWMCSQKGEYEKYISSILNFFAASQNVDNRFETIFPEDYSYGAKSAISEIEIPFAVGRRGRIKSIRLGGADCAHGLISGTTGSGKSTLLHMIINSVIMHYKPEDVELWLADYKQVEMAIYRYHTPPHIKFVGTDRSEEFTFAFLDYIYQEYERRTVLFKENGERNYVNYVKKPGVEKLPRILVLIDEFHVMTQQIQGTGYAEILENILAESRAVGISCLFSDQAISVGLRGLTEKGKKQIMVRLAMMNDPGELKETLGFDIDKDSIPVMSVGEVTIKRKREVINDKGEKENRFFLETDKVIFLTDECRERIAEKARNLYSLGRKPIVVDGKNRVRADWQIIEEYEKKEGKDPERLWLYLGTPSNLEDCFCVRLLRNFGYNLISIGEDVKLLRSILWHTVQSVRRMNAYRICVIADENDDLYLACERELKELERMDDRIEILTKYSDICKGILKLESEMEKRRKIQEKEAVMILWLGLDNMAREFSYYPEKPVKKYQEKKSTFDSLVFNTDSKFAALFGTAGELPKEEAQEQEEAAFNASENIRALIEEGPKRGIYNFVFYPSALSLKTVRFAKLEYFKCKIGFYMDNDSALDYFGKSRLMQDVSEETAVYYDGGKKGRHFLPYKV